MDEIVEVIELGFDFFPNWLEFAFVIFVVKKFVRVSDCVKNDTVDTGDKGLILVGFTEQFLVEGTLQSGTYI